MPESSAGELALTWTTSTVFRSGAPILVKMMLKIKIPMKMLRSGPPAMTSSRFQALAAANPPLILGSFSPFGLTKAPKGIQLRLNNVPLYVNSFAKRGG